MKKKILEYLFVAGVSMAALTESAEAQSAWTKKGNATVDSATTAQLKNLGYNISNATIYSYNANPDSTQVLVSAVKGGEWDANQKRVSLASFGRNATAFDSLQLGRVRMGDVNKQKTITFQESKTFTEASGFSASPAVAPDKRLAYAMDALKQQ